MLAKKSKNWWTTRTYAYSVTVIDALESWIFCFDYFGIYIRTSYRMGSSAIWHIFFEFQIFRHIFRAFRRGKYRKDLERKKYMPYCTRITCDNLFIVNTKDKISYQSVHIKFICKHFISNKNLYQSLIFIKLSSNLNLFLINEWFSYITHHFYLLSAYPEHPTKHPLHQRFSCLLLFRTRNFFKLCNFDSYIIDIFCLTYLLRMISNIIILEYGNEQIILYERVIIYL